MARPALSATRGIDIIDLLATSPERGFTLSEIMRATGINPASCHAVLNALAERGYVRRDAVRRTFHLGPVLAAVGDAAVRGQALLARAGEAAGALAGELDVPVVLTTMVGEDLVGVFAAADRGGRWPSLRPGERRPLVPPLGAPFLAWGDDAAVLAWLARGVHAGDEGVEAELRGGLAMIRERGFQVSLRQAGQPRLAAEIAELARGGRGADMRERIVSRVGALDRVAQPEAIVPEALYDVILIAAPVFDRDGACAFNLCLGDFAAPLAGADVLALAERLLEACVQVMLADR
ncbi:MAG: helix-turn-helix domain-containing protein [Sphingomonadales bacterium]|nr:helix-turn-helix domain-containing protein [Sphingomonadales bacterium]